MQPVNERREGRSVPDGSVDGVLELEANGRFAASGGTEFTCRRRGSMSVPPVRVQQVAARDLDKSEAAFQIANRCLGTLPIPTI